MFTMKEVSDTGTTMAGVRLAGPTTFPGRRRSAQEQAAPLVVWQWLTVALDELDYGIVLLTGGTQVAYVNYAARVELDERHPLQLDNKTLQARSSVDAVALRNAIGQASERGLRRLLTVGTGKRQASMSIVPLEFPESDCRAVLVVLGKSAVCESLSLQGYARAHGLTSAETRILGDLCNGAEPTEIASSLGVAISTIRTHICSIRAKTGAPSIRALVRQVAVLPPLKGVLREEPACALAA